MVCTQLGVQPVWVRLQVGGVRTGVRVVGRAGGAWCVVRGAWCVVRGAWCVVRGAWCVVRGAWVRGVVVDGRVARALTWAK